MKTSSLVGGKNIHDKGKTASAILVPYDSVNTPSNWKGMTNDRFYDMEEDSIVTELKLAHSSYALSTSNVQAMLTCLKENDVDRHSVPKADKTSQNICYIASDNCIRQAIVL